MYLLLFTIAGILDNSFSLTVFLTSKDLREKLTNLYLINQSGLDLFASIFLLLFTLSVTDGEVGSGIAAQLHCRSVKNVQRVSVKRCAIKFSEKVCNMVE